MSSLSPKSATSPQSSAGQKRARHSSHDRDCVEQHQEHASPDPGAAVGAGAAAAAGQGGAASSSSFRNVSACNRCRLRKNRCDQRLPACTACEKARVKCVGYDPITKREIPRSYVYYLESRLAYLESLLRSNRVEFAPPEDLVAATTAAGGNSSSSSDGVPVPNGSTPATTSGGDARQKKEEQGQQKERDKLDKLVSHATAVAVQGASDTRFLGSTSGISFARLVFTAVKSSLSGAPSERGGDGGKAMSVVGTSSSAMRDSYFGLHTKPTTKPAPFPSRAVGLRLVELFFEHANPQIPILHRNEFMETFEMVYSSPNRDRSPKESYFLNIVFAIGSAIIVGKPSEEDTKLGSVRSNKPPQHKRRKLADDEQSQPEEYHASAAVHLESVIGSSSLDSSEGISGSLEELQAVLLMASFALLRPVPPGLWYLTGVAVRLAIDLGLHAEDITDLDQTNANEAEDANGDRFSDASRGRRKNSSAIQDPKERGRRQYLRDFRRRLWWCVYSFDRLVSTCVGRPFGISDHDVTTEFPSLLDDQYITPAGIGMPQGGHDAPSYKHVAYHYFRLRLLQSEILQVLQYRQAEQLRNRGVNKDNPYMLTDLPSPFLKAFNGSFRHWREDIDRRLWEWKGSAPTQAETGVQFSLLFLELNYWQAVIMLYRQSLSVPEALADDVRSAHEDVQAPSVLNIELREDEDTVFMKVAEAGQKVLKLYRQLHRLYLVNYTYLATHHLFMAGISFLYAIWHSPVVRSHLTIDDVDFTVLAATSVLDDLVEKCPPADACRDAFSRMHKATMKMCLASTGFGSAVNLDTRVEEQSQRMQQDDMMGFQSIQPQQPTEQLDPNNPNFPYAIPDDLKRRRPEFDYDMKQLFSEEEGESRPFRRLSKFAARAILRHQQQQQPQAYPTRSVFNPSLDAAQQSSLGSNEQTLQQSQSPYDSPFSAQSFQTPQQQQLQSQQQAYAPSQAVFSPFSDLDFLDNVSVPDNLVNPGADGVAPLDLDFSFGGIGWDGNLPGLSNNFDGQGVDLFDGFFFGGTGGGGSL